MDINKMAARKAAIGWWRDNQHVNAICDGHNCLRPIEKDGGYLCQSLTFGSADLVCETCFDGSSQYEAYSRNHGQDVEEVHTYPLLVQRQLNEALKSMGLAAHVVRVVIPTDHELPHAEYACDRHYHLGQAYLVGNQSGLAIHRFKQALASYTGQSQYSNFDHITNLALAESYAAVDVARWADALECVTRVLFSLPDDSLALAIRARVETRAGRYSDAYQSAMLALKSDPKNVEASFYLGIVGYQIARAEGNISEMSLSIENLKITESLCPFPSTLPEIIRQCEEELESTRG